MKKILSKINYPLLIITIIFAIFGLVMIYSSSNVSAILRYDVDSSYFFKKQFIFEIAAFIGGFIFILKLPTKYYRYFSKIAIFGIIAVLALLFIAGSVANGAKSWYEIGKMSIQPTEFAKIFLIIYLAVYYHRVSTKPKNKKINFIDMFFPLIPAIITFILVAAQPDLGGAAIIALITAAIFFSLPFGKPAKKAIYKVGILGIVIMAIAIIFLGKNFLQGYQVNRILHFSKPCARVNYGDNDTGYQVCNGFIAIHNGGLFGVGLGNSTQKRLYLPDSHTDFIFPIICEELGLIAGILVIIGYFAMLFIILNIAKEARTLRNSILVFGIFIYLMAHILINILGVLSLIPLTGVPLPFLSYGGSYNICVIAALCIVQRVNIENKEEAIKEKIARIE
ncbi:MAG TPA: hypothetical protein DCE23_06190 [Firmicutes bacterium]|nr:hypothetical protein [Bacillota bacterium]